MTSKIFSIFLAFLMCFSPAFYVYADNTSPSITRLLKGEAAPFSGSLLNDAALIKIQTDADAERKHCELEKKYLIMRGEVDCDLKVNGAKIEIDALQKKYNAVVSIKEDEIKRLQDLALKADDGSSYKWWLAGGVGIGIVVTVGAFLLASQVQKVQ